MTPNIPEAITSIDYILDAYDKVFSSLKKDVKGYISNPIFLPGNFQIKFDSLVDSDSVVSIIYLNGDIASHLHRLNRYGYCNLGIRFEITAEKMLAYGLFRIKIIDPSFKKVSKRSDNGAPLRMPM